jgi:DMSO/TMAO reductase YedYZ heme-binding membrane subunit
VPLTAYLHAMGDWSVRFLILSLAITPMRRIANAPSEIDAEDDLARHPGQVELLVGDVEREVK